MSTAKPELISFKLCPYVQRSVIMLAEKGVEFATTYVDLSDKPAWFLELSPLGKVPVLRVGDTVLFESAIINEYLDESHLPALHPRDPLRRAHNRAWIEFGAVLLKSRYGLMTATDKEAFDARKDQVMRALSRVEEQLGESPYFNGKAFSLVDAAYAPLLIRLAVMEDMCHLGLFDGVPLVTAWHQALLEYPAVKASLFPGFMEEVAASIRGRNGYITRYISG